MYVGSVLEGVSVEDIIHMEKVRREKLLQKGRSQQIAKPSSYIVQNENQNNQRSQVPPFKSLHLGTALRDNIDTQARQRSSLKKSSSQENSTVSPFSKNTLSNNRKAYDTTDDSFKIKRQIKFDN